MKKLLKLYIELSTIVVSELEDYLPNTPYNYLRLTTYLAVIESTVDLSIINRNSIFRVQDGNQILWLILKYQNSMVIYIGININYIEDFKVDASSFLEKKCREFINHYGDWICHTFLIDFEDILNGEKDIVSVSELNILKWASEIAQTMLRNIIYPILYERISDEKKAISQLEENISKLQQLGLSIPTVEQMARQVNMSGSKFKILFKQLYGESPHQYFLKKNYYTHTNYSVLENSTFHKLHIK